MMVQDQRMDEGGCNDGPRRTNDLGRAGREVTRSGLDPADPAGVFREDLDLLLLAERCHRPFRGADDVLFPHGIVSFLGRASIEKDS